MSSRAARFVPLGTAALALAVLWPFVLAPGVPLFLHDWVWSPYAGRTLWTWQFLLSAWRQTGLGEPNSALTANPLGWLKPASAVLGSGRGSLLLYLFASVWAAIGGVYDLARRGLHATVSRAFASAALFAATPLLFNKIASGQSSYWAATAAFAWGLSWWLRALETRDVRAALRACALFALATLQVHFLVFAWCAYLFGALAARTRWAWGAACAGALGCAVLVLPELYFIVLRGPLRGADISPQYRSWIAAQSAYPSDAFAMLGYSARYAERALGGEPLVSVLHDAAYIVAALALIGAIVARKPAATTLGLLGATGVTIAMGGFAPFGDAVASFALRVPFAGFFREYYHATVLYALAICVLAPLGFEALPARARGIGTGVTFVLAATMGIGAWSGGFARVLPFVPAPPYHAALRRALAPEEARVLFLPAQEPLRVSGDVVGGNDGTDWADALHHSVYDFYLPPPIAAIEASLAAGDADLARTLLPRLGVDAVVVRADVTSGAYSRADERAATLRALRAAFGPPKVLDRGVDVFPVDALPLLGVASSVGDADEPGIDASDAVAGLERDAPAADRGWIARRDAPSLFADALPAGSYGVVTSRPGARATIAAAEPRAALVWARNGIEIGDRVVQAPTLRRVALAPGAVVVRARGPAAIVEIGEEPLAHVPALAPATLGAVRHVAPWAYRATFSVHGEAAIVLREAYDPAWTLEARGLEVIRHLRADGYANLWLVRGSGTYDVTVSYAWQTIATASLVLSALAFIGIALPACAPASWWRRPGSTRDAAGGS